MKKFWKAFGITAALAALVPVSIKEDKETGKKTYKSLLMSLDVKTDEEAQEKQIGLNIGDGLISSAIVNAVTARREAELFTDDPAEAVVAEAIADDVPADFDDAQTAADEADDEALADISPEGEPTVPVIEDLESEA